LIRFWGVERCRKHILRISAGGVVARVESGASRREATEHLEIIASTAIKWAFLRHIAMVQKTWKLETAHCEAGWTPVSNPPAGYGLLTVVSHDGRCCEPALRQALRTCTTTLLVLSGLASQYCSFAAARNAPAQSALAAATMLMPRVQLQNTPTNVTAIGSSARPAYPLKASANNRYLVDQNDVPFLWSAILRKP
jgi:hypothetical protein